MRDGWDMFFGALALSCALAVIALSYCIGADRVYQECKATGEYRVGFEKKMTCEVMK